MRGTLAIPGMEPRTSLLSRNLSALSTSEPAPSVRVEPSVARRGTCDRRIWTKALAFATDAGSYAVCLRVSKFVRLEGGDGSC